MLFIPNTLFWATYEQIGNTTILWIDDNVDRGIDLFRWTAQIPTTWFLAINPFLIFAFTPLVVTLWKRQAARGTEPSTITKMALGCFGVTAANLIYAFAAFHAGAGQASWLWVVAAIAIFTVGELYLSPVGLSLVTKVAPCANPVDDDGHLAGDQFHRQFPGRLARQFLESDGKAGILSDDRRHLGACRRDDLRVPSAAARGITRIDCGTLLTIGTRGRRKSLPGPAAG